MSNGVISILRVLNKEPVILSLTPDQFDFFVWLQQRDYISDSVTLDEVEVIIPRGE